ncbi:MAG TPA: addiction module toxin RelE [Alphaproteobacteria bacterium]|nr:addiction module toxin RelE [Alphaproteobacteria bacterium]
MHEFLLEEELTKKISKLFRKDKVTYEILMKKIGEIINSKDLNHYKNLRTPLQEFKRVHIRGNFVLIFKCVKDKILFYDFDHHDQIYKKKI